MSAQRAGDPAEVKDYPHYIDGDWTDPLSGEWLDSEDPYTRTSWARVGKGGEADVDRAVRAASRAFESGPWRELTASRRGALMFRVADLIEANAEELARLATRDSGRTITDMLVAARYSAEYFRYYGGLADKLEGTVPPLDRSDHFGYTRPEPLGVVAAITPWNNPLILLTMKLAPGLAAGNTFVIKPHEAAAVCILEMVALFGEAGFPDGVVNVVNGLGQEVGPPLVAHPLVRKIAFTGGEVAGRAIHELAAKHFKPVLLELGGKSPVLIFEDARLDDAAKKVVEGMFTTSGQGCFVCSRVLIHDSVHDEFVALLAKYAQEARLGDPSDPATELGPLANAGQLERVTGYLRLAENEGARAVVGRTSGSSPLGGYFVEPTILTGSDNSMRHAREEIFGPVMACMRFSDEDEAIRIANDTNFGLAAGVWTENVRRAIRVGHRLNAGTVWVNSYRTLSVTIPFGGYKDSGIGRENGIEAIGEYLQTKSILIGLSESVPAPFGK